MDWDKLHSDEDNNSVTLIGVAQAKGSSEAHDNNRVLFIGVSQSNQKSNASQDDDDDNTDTDTDTNDGILSIVGVPVANKKDLHSQYDPDADGLEEMKPIQKQASVKHILIDFDIVAYRKNSKMFAARLYCFYVLFYIILI